MEYIGKYLKKFLSRVLQEFLQIFFKKVQFHVKMFSQRFGDLFRNSFRGFLRNSDFFQELIQTLMLHFFRRYLQVPPRGSRGITPFQEKLRKLSRNSSQSTFRMLQKFLQIFTQGTVRIYSDFLLRLFYFFFSGDAPGIKSPEILSAVPVKIFRELKYFMKNWCISWKKSASTCVSKFWGNFSNIQKGFIWNTSTDFPWIPLERGITSQVAHMS